MLKQAQVEHYGFQHQLTGKMSCGWKHETFGAGVSARTSSDQNTLTESTATSTSDSEASRLLSISSPQDTVHQEPGRAARTNLIALGEGWVTTGCAAAECHRASRDTAPWAICPGHRDNRALRAKCSQAQKAEPNWRESGGSGSETGRQGGTICQPGLMSNNQIECHQGSQGRGSYQMKSQKRLQGSVVQLEELKWKWRMPKWVESLFFQGNNLYKLLLRSQRGSQLR